MTSDTKTKIKTKLELYYNYTVTAILAGTFLYFLPTMMKDEDFQNGMLYMFITGVVGFGFLLGNRS